VISDLPVNGGGDDVEARFLYAAEGLHAGAEHVLVRDGPGEGIEVLHQPMRIGQGSERNSGAGTYFPVRMPPEALVYSSRS
jgi:hypothetical protein